MENDSQLPAAGSDTVDRVDLVLTDDPLGSFDLPRRIYDSISDHLPLCLQRGDDDRSSTLHYPSLPLREQHGDVVKLQTRNLFAILDLLIAHGVQPCVHRWFNNAACISPSVNPNIFQSPGKLSANESINRSQSLSSILSVYRAGQLVNRDSQRKFDDAAILCALFPNAPIVLVASSRDEVELVGTELEKRLPESVHRAFGNDARPECRITVATYGAFRSLGLMDAPFVIVPIWKPGYPRWMKLISWNPWRDRIYFLRTVDEAVSERDNDDLLGRVGPVLLQPDVSPDSSIVFSVYRFGGPSTAQARSQSCRVPNTPINKRKLYLRHRQRNQAIASIAQSFDGAEGPIAVLVENTLHAGALAKLLPGWLVVSRDVVPADPSTPMIVTLTAAAAWTQFRPWTLVIGMGGPPSR